MKEEKINDNIENPKLVDSMIVDAVPHSNTYCPNECDQCYFNHGFYTQPPIMPSLQQVGKKIVRVNSGYDSNLDEEGNLDPTFTIEATKHYPDKYYNTSIPKFDFPAPVIFTANGRYTDEAFLAAPDTDNLLVVNIRTNTWNLKTVIAATRYYTSLNVYVHVTWMRYFDEKKVQHPKNYTFREHLVHSYWRLNAEVKAKVFNYITAMSGAAGQSNPNLIIACGSRSGNLENDYCKDCHLCYDIYWDHIYRRKYMSEHITRMRRTKRYRGLWVATQHMPPEAVVRKLRERGFYPEKEAKNDS